jgi:hypothetical protein
MPHFDPQLPAGAPCRCSEERDHGSTAWPGTSDPASRRDPRPAHSAGRGVPGPGGCPR